MYTHPMVLRRLNGLIILKYLEQSFALSASVIKNYCDTSLIEVLYKVEWSVSSPILGRLEQALQKPWILKDQEEFFGYFKGMQEGTFQAEGKSA